MSHRQQRLRANRVEVSRALFLGQAHTPIGEIARIDELDWALWAPGCKHFAPLCDPARPVRKPIRRVVWASDEAWPHVRDSPKKISLKRRFAAGFEWAIAIISFSERRGLVVRAPGRKPCISRNTGDERIVLDPPIQNLCHPARLPRSVGACVDHGI